MSTSRNFPAPSPDVTERQSRKSRPRLRLLPGVIPHEPAFLWGNLGRCLLVFILFCLFCVVPAIAEEATVYWAPWVTKTTTNSATINWLGASNKGGEIEYATSKYYDEHQAFDKTKSAPTATAYQHVELTGLEPNTAYTYRVRPSGNADLFSNRTFRTMPVSGPFTFVVISDSQEGHNYTEAMRFKPVADAIAKEKDVLFILHGGDYAGHDSQGLWTKYFEAADAMLAKFPIFNTIGNHEYHTSGGNWPPTAADQYHWTYGIPPAGPLNHYFDCAGIRFIILDSPDPNNTDSDDPHTSLALTQSQAPWLEALLKNNNLGVFTIHHHPIWDFWSPTIDPNLQPWETLYHKYRISANFAGHTHTYQRYSVNGIPYFIVGTAGGRFADLTNGDTPAWYVRGVTRMLGYLKVTVDPANNRATAEQIFVASVEEDDSNETPQKLDPPVIWDTITFPLRLKFPLSSGGGGGGGGVIDCFIATAAFGSSLHPYVATLREFRDRILLTSRPGAAFVDWYYRISPPIADTLQRSDSLKAGVRILLLPLIGLSFLCLKVGCLPTLMIFLLLAGIGYIGLRKLRSLNHLSA
jgi:hypothetical protein